MTHVVTLKKPARKALAALAVEYRDATTRAIEALAETPRPDGCAKLRGEYEGCYRIEVRNQIRVIYEINDGALTVLVVTIGNRGDVYKK